MNSCTMQHGITTSETNRSATASDTRTGPCEGHVSKFNVTWRSYEGHQVIWRMWKSHQGHGTLTATL